MATSGSTDWTLTRDNIVTAAFRKIGVVTPDGTATAAQLTAGADVLNALVKNYQTRGVRLWTVEWVTKALAASTEITGTDGLIYTCIRSHTSASANQPITGADWSTVWRLRGSTGGAWALSQSYSNTGDFAVASDTIGIEKAFLRSSNYSDTPLKLIGRMEYADIPDKSATGTPTVLCYDQRLTPNIFLWPIPTDTTEVLHVLRVRALEDMDASGDNADIPVRWLRPLIYELSVDLADDWQVPVDVRDRMERKAAILFDQAKRNDVEPIDEEYTSPAFDESRR